MQYLCVFITLSATSQQGSLVTDSKQDESGGEGTDGGKREMLRKVHMKKRMYEWREFPSLHVHVW